MAKIDLSIIIVDYKSKKYLFDCLRSIKQHLIDINYEIIIVDNNQVQEDRIQDSELKRLSLPAYSLRLMTENKGFGGGNNLGAKEARGEYLLLLNPDTIIFDNSIKKMLEFHKAHTEIGALTCLIGPTKNTLQKNFFGQFQSLAGLTIRRYNHPIHPRGVCFQSTPGVNNQQEFFLCDIVTGAALMIKKELFENLGGFDEGFFMYLEDDDLCKRLVDAGYKNAVLCTARIIHLEGKSSDSKQKKKYYFKSQDYYWQKHNGRLATLLMRLLRWPYKIIRMVYVIFW